MQPYLSAEAIRTATWLLGGMAALGLGGFVFRQRLGQRGLSALLLLVLLLGLYGLLILLAPRGELTGLAGVTLLIGGYWVMSRFEGVDKPPGS